MSLSRLPDVLLHHLLQGPLRCAIVNSMLFIGTRLPETVENVIFVRGDDELLYGETHPLGKVPGQDIPKVPSRGHKTDMACGGIECARADE